MKNETIGKKRQEGHKELYTKSRWREKETTPLPVGDILVFTILGKAQIHKKTATNK